MNICYQARACARIITSSQMLPLRYCISHQNCEPPKIILKPSSITVVVFVTIAVSPGVVPSDPVSRTPEPSQPKSPRIEPFSLRPHACYCLHERSGCQMQPLRLLQALSSFAGRFSSAAPLSPLGSSILQVAFFSFQPSQWLLQVWVGSLRR